MYYCFKFDDNCLHLRNHLNEELKVSYEELLNLSKENSLYGISYIGNKLRITTFDSLESIVRKFNVAQRLLGKDNKFKCGLKDTQHGIILEKVSDDVINLVVPSFVTSIGECCCKGLLNLKSVVLPNSVEYILPNAFSNCISLESVKFSNFLSEIGESAFQGSGLSSAVFCKSIKTLDRNCFMDCINLSSVEFEKESIVSLGVNCFSGCRMLSNIKLPRIKSLPVGVFSACSSLGCIDLPEGLFHLYDSCFGVASLYLS